MWYCTYIENLGMGKLVASHTVKVIGNNFVIMAVNEYAKYNFTIFDNIDEESLDEQLMIRQIPQYFPSPKSFHILYLLTVILECFKSWLELQIDSFGLSVI